MAVNVNFNGKRKMIGYLDDELAQEISMKYHVGEDNEIYGEILEVTGGTGDKLALGCNIEKVEFELK